MGEKKLNESQTLTDQTAVTSNGTGSTVYLPIGLSAVALTLDVLTAIASSADKLDVYVQTQVDGSHWVDVCHFPQIDAVMRASSSSSSSWPEGQSYKLSFEKLISEAAEAGFNVGSTLSAGDVRDLIGDAWRVRWEVTNDSGRAAFSFRVKACPM